MWKKRSNCGLFDRDKKETNEKERKKNATSQKSLGYGLEEANGQRLFVLREGEDMAEKEGAQSLRECSGDI